MGFAIQDKDQIPQGERRRWGPWLWVRTSSVASVALGDAVDVLCLSELVIVMSRKVLRRDTLICGSFL